jgi:hypothetical protein
LLDEQQHGRLIRARLAVHGGEGGSQHVLIVRQHHFQGGRQHGTAGHAGEVARPPAEEVGQHVGGEPLLPVEGVAVQVSLGLQQGRRRHDHADRLQEAEPVTVGQQLGVRGHGRYPVTGQR